MIKKLLFVLLCWASLAQAETRPWTDEEKYLGTALGVALLADWSSTRYAARHGWPNVKEDNIFLGDHPSVSKLDRHFIIGVPILFWLFDHADENRKMGLIGMTALEIYASSNNARVGLRFKF